MLPFMKLTSPAKIRETILRVKVQCSRCKKAVEELESDQGTGGFYRVDTGYWQQFAQEGESILCVHCMQISPEYRKFYGSPN